MQPNIAAVICSIFILTVFIMDSKRKTDISINHWIPFIWFLIVSSKSVSQWLGTTASVGIDSTDPGSSPIDATILTILIVAGIIILSRRLEQCKQILKNNRWLVFLILYCFLSILWSDYPFISFKRWFRGLGTFIMVLVVLTEIDPLETIKTMLRRCAFLMIPLSILFIKYFRHIGVYYESWGAIGYCGVTTNKNLLGRLCLILGLYFFWEVFINWKNQNNKSADVYKTELFINITFLIMIFWLLRKANSATSLGCFIIAICIMISLNSLYIRRNINYITIISLLLVSIISLLGLTSEVGSIFVNSLNRDLTFTGRREIWSLCLKFAENPLFGVGYDSFWIGERLQLFWNNLEGANIIQAHNGYIDVYLQIGIIGLSLLLGVIFSTYKKITKTIVNDYKVGIFQLSFFLAYLLYNITESSLKLHHLFWFVFLLIELTKTQNEGPIIQVPSPATTAT